MTPTEFITSHEYKSASESAKVEYITRLGVLCDNKPPTQEQHDIAYQDFWDAVRLEEGLS